MNGLVQRGRRAGLVVLGALVLSLSAAPAPASSQLRSADRVASVAGGGTFAVPETRQRPRFRWWWPGAWVEPGEVKREVDAMADAGFGGFEIADVRDSIRVPMDPRVYGWGSPRWNANVQAALEQAVERGLKADITVGPHWPASVAGITPDSAAAAKELVYGQVTVAGGATFDADLPQPANPPSGTALGNPDPAVTPELVAVHVARAVSDPAVRPVRLDPSSLTDVLSRVHDGHLRWTAPGGGTWVVVAEYARGTGQIQRLFDFSAATSPLTDPQSFVIDHFGSAGAQALIASWERSLLPDRTRALLRRIRGSFFEDSLELRSEQYWTPSFLREFRARRGYALRPRLPLALRVPDITFTGVEPGPPAYTFGDDTGDRVMHDYDQTLSDLYVDNHLRTLRNWAHTLNMKYRVQPYGGPVDSARAAATVDIPEGESLGFASNPDAYRVLAAGRDLGRRRLLSVELGAFFGAAYQVTLPQLEGTANLDYALGVNQAVIHGFAYRDSPDSRWPGFAAFSPLFLPGGFGEAWNPHQPAWAEMPDVAAYLSRSQAVLQTGRQKTDVAIYDPAFDASKGDPTGNAGPLWNDPGLQRAGYTYQFPSPETLLLPDAVVRARRLDPAGPAYKALVARGEVSMDAARRILCTRGRACRSSSSATCRRGRRPCTGRPSMTPHCRTPSMS
jgi:hypothetical protein